jgi:hypothetical protein
LLEGKNVILREEWKEPKILTKDRLKKGSFWFCGKALARKT